MSFLFIVVLVKLPIVGVAITPFLGSSTSQFFRQRGLGLGLVVERGPDREARTSHLLFSIFNMRVNLCHERLVGGAIDTKEVLYVGHKFFSFMKPSQLRVTVPGEELHCIFSTYSYTIKHGCFVLGGC